MNRLIKLALRRKEARIRRWAAREGYRVHKSRSRETNLDDHGEYMLVDNSNNTPVLGWWFHASLDEIAEYLRG